MVKPLPSCRFQEYNWGKNSFGAFAFFRNGGYVLCNQKIVASCVCSWYIYEDITGCTMNLCKLYPLKVHKHEIFLWTIFAETEFLWLQGPVTQDFRKSYSIRPRYSTFQPFRVCSVSDEIISAYAQPAFKSFPCMLRVQ